MDMTLRLWFCFFLGCNVLLFATLMSTFQSKL